MLIVVFDAGPLITACKFEVHGKLVIDHLLSCCSVLIPHSVEEEVAVLGARYPDGAIAGERIARSDIRVLSIVEQKWEQQLSSYALGDGESDSIELCGQVREAEALVVDDYLAFIAAARIGLRTWMFPDLVVELVMSERLTLEVAEAILETVRPRYRKGIIEHSLIHLQELRNAKSSGSR